MLETPHFEIFYSAQQHDLGLYYAQIAELSYAEVMTIFTVAPSEKVVVIINDSTDAPNGFTTLIPYPYIMIFPVQVGKDETLSEAGEWAKELFVHELTHVFQLYPAEGAYKYIKPIFGTIVAPNLLAPIWWKEGMAVEFESRFSDQGRTRSYFQDAGIRALSLDGQLIRYQLPEANENLPSWPYGGRPYLLGSMFLSDIGTKNEGKAINDIVLGQSRRVPYFIESPHANLFDMSFSDHFTNMIASAQKNVQAQIQKIKTQRVTQTQPVDATHVSSEHPRIDAAGKTLGLISFERKKKRHITFYNLGENLQWTRLKFEKNPSEDVAGFEFHPTERKILFEKLDQVDSKNYYSDLYIFDLNSDKQQRLTKGARARDAIWSLDGSKIFYISTFNGRTQLRMMGAEADVLEQLFETDVKERIDEIAVIDQNQLYLSIKDSKGVIHPYTFDLNERKLIPYPVSLEGIEHFKIKNHQAYVTSTQSGVSNIYRIDAARKVPVTNFLTGSLDFDIIPEKNYGVASVFTATGPQVEFFILADYKELPKISNPVRDRYHYQALESPKFESNEDEAPSLKYLYPHYWIPFVSTSSNNKGIFFQALTGGQDPLLIHQYSLRLEYDSYIERLSYDVNYTNSSLNWPITVAALRSYTPVGGFENYIERDVTSIGVLPDTFKLGKKLFLNAGLQNSEITEFDFQTRHVGLYAQGAYSDIEQNLFDIYPTSGWAAFLRLETNKAKNNNLTDFYGDYDKALGSVAGYFSSLLPEDHSICAKVNFLHTFQNVSTRFGTSNSVFPTFSDSFLPEFTLRGYSLGQFFGSRLSTINTEYRFPVKTLNQGSGTAPYFLKRVNGAIIADGLTVDGYSVDRNGLYGKEHMAKNYWSAGVEARLESTIGYVIPMNFILGFYHAFSPQYSDMSALALSLQIGGNFGGFNH